MSELIIRIVQGQATATSDIETIKAITNEAFQADTFFKKPEYYDRFTSNDVVSLLSQSDSAFILVCGSEGEVQGSLFLHWEIKGDEVMYR